jgi:predicted acetyltransferase
MDLAVKVKGMFRPVDDHVAARLADPRAWKVVEAYDWLWLYLVDVAAGLAGRRYSTEGSVVIDVTDGFRPAAGGRFRLDGGPDGAECGRTDAEPDLVLAAPDLGSTYLGGVSLARLHRAGLVEERTPGAVAKAAAMFATDPQPYCNTGF